MALPPRWLLFALVVAVTAAAPLSTAGGRVAPPTVPGTSAAASHCSHAQAPVSLVPVDSIEALRVKYEHETGFVDVLLESVPEARAVAVFDLDARGNEPLPPAYPLASGMPVSVSGERFTTLMTPPDAFTNDPPLIPDPCQLRISPGARVSTPVGGCSLNFIFTDAAGRYYAGTAGHCFGGIGERASVPGLGEIGRSRFSVAYGVGTDFALLEIYPSQYANINPAMCHWGGPTAPAGATPGLVRHYGFGTGYGSTQFTRPRTGVASSSGTMTFTMEGLVAPGDSGSGARLDGGEALGLITHGTGAVGIGRGTLLTRAIWLAETETGLDLSLVTAPVA